MSDPQLPLRIFAVDPATTLSGWCVLDLLSTDPLSIRIVAHGQIDGNQLLKTRKEMRKVFQNQYCVLDALEEEYTRLLEEYKPDVVVSEGLFVHLHVAAALALSLAISILRRCAHKVLYKDLVSIPPTISKLAFTGKGNADKDAMREAYGQAHYLIKTDYDSNITEHEIDAISHGCAFVKRDITKEVVQLSTKEKKRLKREKAKAKLEAQKQKQ